MRWAVSLIQLGVGQVGAEVARLIRDQASMWRERYGLDVRYSAIGDSSGFALADEAHGIVDETARFVNGVLEARANGGRLAMMPNALGADRWRDALERAMAAAGAPEHVVMLDCAAGPSTTPLLIAGRDAGAHVVLANKDPLVGPIADFTTLTGRSRSGSARFSATVGAGLPVVATLAALVASGDTVKTVDARASGSLGFLCDRLSSGDRFNTAVREAMERGYTEPDPRLDLSGFDVARKLLILARVAGFERDLRDVAVESLVPPGAEPLEREAFLASLDEYAGFLAERAAKARASGRVLRYFGRIAEGGRLSASLVALTPEDAMARGGGPENVFWLRTARYDNYPMTISGPGAGVAVTAGAVVADLLRALEVLPC